MAKASAPPVPPPPRPQEEYWVPTLLAADGAGTFVDCFVTERGHKLTKTIASSVPPREEEEEATITDEGLSNSWSPVMLIGGYPEARPSFLLLIKMPTNAKCECKLTCL